MASKGQSLTLTFVDWNNATGAGQTGDAANVVLRWVRDGTSAAPDGSPSITEVDSTNAPGLYKVTLDATDCTCNFGTLCGKTSTASCSIIPQSVSFEQLPTAPPAASGGLPTFGTGAGQINPDGAGNVYPNLTAANTIEGAYTVTQAIQWMLAALAGQLSGATGTTITIKNPSGGTTRIVATVDSSGDRSAITLT